LCTAAASWRTNAQGHNAALGCRAWLASIAAKRQIKEQSWRGEQAKEDGLATGGSGGGGRRGRGGTGNMGRRGKGGRF